MHSLCWRPFVLSTQYVDLCKTAQNSRWLMNFIFRMSFNWIYFSSILFTCPYDYIFKNRNLVNYIVMWLDKSDKETFIYVFYIFILYCCLRDCANFRICSICFCFYLNYFVNSFVIFITVSSYLPGSRWTWRTCVYVS